MAWVTKARVKYALAGAGAIYLVLFGGYLLYSGVKPKQPQGPSELELHPEKQGEILPQRRAKELQEELKLTDEQTQQITNILRQNPQNESDEAGSRERRHASREAIDKVLTPEQKAQLDQERGQFGGPDGPGGEMGMMNQERIDSLKEKMSPEQRERFDKQMQQMQKRRDQFRNNRGQGGGERGPRGGGNRRQNVPPQ